MEGDGVGDVEVQLAVELVVVFFVDQIVEGRELEAADAAGGGVAGGHHARGQLAAEFVTAVVPEEGRTARRAVIAGVRGARPAAVIDGVHGRAGPVTLVDVQARTVAVAGGQQDIAAVEQAAPGDIEGVVAVGAVHEQVVGVDFEAVQVLAGDEVHNAADGVGAVGGSRAVLQDFHPAGRGRGNEAKVLTAALEGGLGGVGQTTAVHQDQGPRGAEAAQVDGRSAGAAVIAVAFAKRRLRGADGLDQLHDAGRALALQFRRAEDVHRQGGVFRRAGDE